MLYVSSQKLAEAVGVSPGIVNRWIQSGWLRGVDREGRRGAAIWTSDREVLVEFDSLPRLIEAFHLEVDLDRLRTSAIEKHGESDTPANRACD
jgi:hypothetical protein